jgi:hypothetical protein
MFGIRAFYVVLALAVASMSPASAEQKIRC